jgi:predicted PurR-regulated permease PerM
MLVVSLIASVIDNILKPLLAGGDTKISAIVGFTSVVGAIIMMGLPGLLLGPVIMNLFARMMPILLPMLKPENKVTT